MRCWSEEMDLEAGLVMWVLMTMGSLPSMYRYLYMYIILVRVYRMLPLLGAPLPVLFSWSRLVVLSPII